MLRTAPSPTPVAQTIAVVQHPSVPRELWHFFFYAEGTDRYVVMFRSAVFGGLTKLRNLLPKFVPQRAARGSASGSQCSEMYSLNPGRVRAENAHAVIAHGCRRGGWSAGIDATV